MKRELEELYDEIILLPARHDLAIGSTWMHYKGKLYVVKGFVVDANTSEILVCYEFTNLSKAISIEFARPLSEFLEKFKRVRQRTIWADYKTGEQVIVKDPYL